ncbi:MAG: hypothetical protein SPJ89_02985 [Treponema sp.]|nr:hypothetical protein [Spirochaetia bacterium]MDD7459830.1 hypothetical protein [Spirochaetales bacterium]MDY5810925.1 hypothetical protein [Treponema sp.]
MAKKFEYVFLTDEVEESVYKTLGKELKKGFERRTAVMNKLGEYGWESCGTRYVYDEIKNDSEPRELFKREIPERVQERKPEQNVER